VETLRGPVDARRAQIEALRAQPVDPGRDAELARLQRELGQLETGYNAAPRSNEDLHIAEARGSNTTVVLEQARPPEQPARPSWRIVTALAALAGLAVAVGLLLLVEYLDDVLRDDARVTRTTGLVTLGFIPRGAASEQVAGGGDRRAHESYRLIGHNLLVATANMNLHLLMVTGPGIGEGKSVAAANLALALAETGLRVILVDADLHRPSQAQLYGVTNRRGLSTLLVNEQETAANVVQATHLSNVQLLPAGPPVPDPSALLTRTQVSARLDELTRLCDVVIVDTPPVLAQPDAQLLASQVDATVLVVDATRSRGRDAARTVDSLHRSGGVVVGVILNRVAPRRMGYTTRDRAADQPAAQVSEGAR
jgi:capsular exopolysaccharide synthesis family protein